MISTEYDPTAAFAALDRTSKAALEATHAAARAGAAVLYEAMRRTATIAKEPHVGKGGKVYAPGTLRAAVYHAFSKDNSRPGRVQFHISWNKKKAPHGHLVDRGYTRKHKVVKTKTGRYITLKAVPLATPVKVPGVRFVLKAHIAGRDAAIDAAKKAFSDRYVQVMRQHLAARGG